MTKKRFTKDDTLMFSAIKDNGKPMKVKEVVDCLNTLYEENREYKQELDNIYILIGTGDWSGLVDLIKDDVK